MPIIAPYKDDDGAEPRPCERVVLTSGAKCIAAITCAMRMASIISYADPMPPKHLSGNQDLLASAVIELALTVAVSTKAWESAG